MRADFTGVEVACDACGTSEVLANHEARPDGVEGTVRAWNGDHWTAVDWYACRPAHVGRAVARALDAWHA